MNFLNENKQIQSVLLNKISYLLSEIDRDLTSKTRGCFDRRFWGWKLTDYPEATYQRNIYLIAWYIQNKKKLKKNEYLHLIQTIEFGLEYLIKIQKVDGSFDQAFPNERSYAATAFILNSILSTLEITENLLSLHIKKLILSSLKKSANFLLRHNEKHGKISNHLAGAALALLKCSFKFNNLDFKNKSLEILSNLINIQSKEGWFPEYENADPGYQSLCTEFLIQISFLIKVPKLENCITKSIKFLSYFIHPDGSFSGEYGSRRTQIYYPGGIALKSKENGLASKMTTFMLKSILNKNTISLNNVDIGNVAAVGSSLILLHKSLPDIKQNSNKITLPFKSKNLFKVFYEANIIIKSNSNYHLICGITNGGTLKIFNKNSKKTIFDDGGYFGKANFKNISTQYFNKLPNLKLFKNKFSFNSNFYLYEQITPSPLKFLFLRVLNLTIMRNIFIGNLIKKVLVKLLIKNNQKLPIKLKRSVYVKNKQIEIIDEITKDKNYKISNLCFGIPFVSIHMASSKYYPNYFTQKIFKYDNSELTNLNNNNQILKRIRLK